MKWLYRLLRIQPLEHLDTCPECGLTDGWHQYTSEQ